MLDTIEQAVKPHDRYQVEVKLDYELLGEKSTRYEVSTYIFVPNRLGINPSTYARTDFYRDIQNYIRFKTPELLLREFCDHSDSPLTSIERMVAGENWHSDPEIRKALINNLKFLAAMLKTSIREHVDLIYRRIEEAPAKGSVHPMIGSLIDEYLNETREIADCYRELFPAFNLPAVDERLFAAYQFADEAISLQIEEHALELYEIVSQNLGKKDGRDRYKMALAACTEKEIRHRKKLGYLSVLNLDDGAENEVFAARASALKKYASSVLFVSTYRREEGRGLEQALFMVAAGVSMLFATGIAFYFQQRVGNFTLPLLIALVVGYMFKDRIKEFGRLLFSRYLENHLYDHRVIIRAPNSNDKLGVLKEKMQFVTEGQVPNGVLKRRASDPLSELESEAGHEYIILHSKEIVLYGDAFQRVFAGVPDLTGLNDITRYDIRAYLRKMDDPTEERWYLSDGEIEQVTTHRVYRMDLLTKYKSVAPKKDKLYSRVRLVLTRDGIKRVEQSRV